MPNELSSREEEELITLPKDRQTVKQKASACEWQ